MRPLFWLLLLGSLALACRSATDITRTDDDVDEWVAEQRAAEKDKQARRSSLPPATSAPPTAAQAPPPAASQAGASPAPCTAAWYEHVEHSIHVSDADGHGPDLGSAEWKAAVEHRLGVRDDASFPEPTSAAWCEQVDARLKAR